MTYHVFLVKKMGWKEEREFISFPTDEYTEEEAQAQFKRIEGETEKNGNVYPYMAYEYQGEKIYSYAYQGVFDENNMPDDI